MTVADKTIAAEKAALRVQAREKRAQIQAGQGQAAAEAIAARGLGFLNLPDDRDCIIAGYAAIGDELDVGPLLRRLHDEGRVLALPVTIGPGKPLVFRRWQPGDDMVRGFMNISEPLPSAPVVEPDILLVPLLAFDSDGYRLGYGGGHYDRTLGELRRTGPVIAVGVAFEEQKIDTLPHDRYDQRLDWILTPNGARAF